MTTLVVVDGAVIIAALGLAASLRIVQQYEEGVLFRLGKATGVRTPGIHAVVPGVDVLRRMSMRIVTMPIQSQGIITRDNVSVDVSAVAYYRVVDATKSVIAIENVASAINQIARPACARSSASTPSTRHSPRPTASTSASARSSTSPPRTGACWSCSSSSRTSNFRTR